MPSNALAFSAALRRESAHITEEELPLFIRKIAGEILVDVVMNTRVDTGRARGGWQVGFVPSDSAPLRVDKDGAMTIEIGFSVLAYVELGQTVYIENNVDYIGWLEYGTDRMVGDFMLTNAIQRATSFFPAPGRID